MGVVCYSFLSSSYLLDVLNNNFVSVKEFALVADIDDSYLYKLLASKHRVTKKTIRKIAYGLSKLDNAEWRPHARRLSQ